MKRLLVAIGMAAVLSNPLLSIAQSGAPAAPPQAAGAVQRLDLSRCIDLALQNNNRSKISRDEVEMALALHRQALSSWWPQVSGSVAASRMDEDPNFLFPFSKISVPASSFTVPASAITLPANALGPGVPPVNAQIPIPPMTVDVPAQTIPIPEQDVKLMNRDNVIASVNATLPIYTGGLRTARIRQARAGVEVARQDERHTDLEVSYDVKRLYYATVMARQLVKISQDTLARMETTLELTEKMYKTGSGTVKKTDYLRNKTMVETIRGVVSEMEGKEHIVSTTLLMLIGRDMAGSIELADAEVPFNPRPPDPKALIDAASANNPEIAKVEAAVRAAEAGVAAAFSGHLPKVALIGSAHKIVNSYDAGVATPINKESWTIGIGVEIPIFQGFRVSNEVREQRANVQKLQHQLSLLREAVALDIRSTCFELARAQQQQKSSFEAAKSATENRELNVRAYQDDLVETKDVIEAQLMEAIMAGQYQKVLYDHVDAQAKLDYVVGAGQTLPKRK